MSAERYDPITPIDTDGLIRMSDGEWIPVEDVLHYGIESESELDEAKTDKFKAGAFTAATAALAIFGGITTYRHLKDK